MLLHEKRYSKGLSAAVRTLGSIGAVLLVCSFSALADNSNDSDDKWFVGSPLTEVSNNSKDKDHTTVSVSNIAVDDSRNGYKFNVEYDLSEHFAIGAAYVDFKDVEMNLNPTGAEQSAFKPGSLPNTADGFTLESIYHYNLSDNIGLTGSIGLFNWEGDFNSGLNNPSNTNKTGTSESGTDVYFGLGGGYQLTEDMTLEINWERYQLKDEATEMWSIGVNYHFK